MKKILALGTPLIFLLGFIIVFASVQVIQPQEWESALESYLAHERVFSETDLNVQAVVKAESPWNFTEAMSAVAIAESVHFDTIGYKTSNQPTATSDFTPGEHHDSGKAPLPYPPFDIWCVALTQNGSERKIVFVALHQNLYNAEIVIHEPIGKLDDEIVKSNLIEIGCELPEGAMQ
jgi:hypothetical protein